MTVEGNSNDGRVAVRDALGSSAHLGVLPPKHGALGNNENLMNATMKQSTTVYDVHLSAPQIKGTEVRTFGQLTSIIEEDFPWVLEHKNICSLLKSAQCHLMMLRNYKHRTGAAPNEIALLADRTGYSTYTIKSWLCRSVLPRIYYILNAHLPVCRDTLDELKDGLDGVTCMSELSRRFANLYKGHRLQRNPKHRGSAERFFHFLEMAEAGHTTHKIARELGLKPSNLRRWFRTPPFLVGLAVSCPRHEPNVGRKWLALKTTGQRMGDFIQVPNAIESPDDILEVLSQLRPEISQDLEQFERENGKMPQHLAFMYLLGIILSDASFDVKGISSRLRLKLSKKYQWSKDFGMGFRYALGLIGIQSSEGKDVEKIDEDGATRHLTVWRSGSSPLFRWIEESLGLTTSRSRIPFQAHWILEMPEDWRIPLLQGLADGDGYASLRAQRAGISTYSNHEFISRLLSSLNIQSYSSCKGVHFSRKNDVKRADELPMFRYAHGRQFRLSQLVLIHEHMRRKHVSPQEIQLIHLYHDQGLTVGEITEKIWIEHGITRRRGTVRKVLNREFNDDDEESHSRTYQLSLI